VITAQQVVTGLCLSAFSAGVTVSGTAATPSINQASCISAPLTTVTGYTSETNAIVQLYSVTGSDPYTYTPISPILVASNTSSGGWTFTPNTPIAAGTTIAARVESALCKTASAYSGSITLSTAPTIDDISTTIDSPVFENYTTISGTGVNDQWIQLYVVPLRKLIINCISTNRCL
jgi:hypothetical protein